MKSSAGLLLTTITTLVVVLLASCATLKKAPDPGKVQAQIAEARAQELELVRATVADLTAVTNKAEYRTSIVARCARCDWETMVRIDHLSNMSVGFFQAM